MQFTLHDADYDTPGFYRTFGRDLPQIVQITQGFNGETALDTFDNGQVVRFHTVSRQKRVITKTSLHGRTKLLGIPLDYKEVQFCVVDNKGKTGKDEFLHDIVKHHKKLPVTIQFSQHKSITVGNQTVSTSFLPTLELTGTYEEVFLLGHFIDEGHISPYVIPLPLYLTKVRMSVVTGIVGASETEWQQHQAYLESEASKTDSDYTHDSCGIAEYHGSGLEDHTDDMYTYTEPVQYINFAQLFSHAKHSLTVGKLTPKSKRAADTKSHNQPKGTVSYDEHTPDNLARDDAHLAPPPVPPRPKRTSVNTKENPNYQNILPSVHVSPFVQNEGCGDYEDVEVGGQMMHFDKRTTASSDKRAKPTDISTVTKDKEDGTSNIKPYSSKDDAQGRPESTRSSLYENIRLQDQVMPVIHANVESVHKPKTTVTKPVIPVKPKMSSSLFGELKNKTEEISQRNQHGSSIEPSHPKPNKQWQKDGKTSAFTQKTVSKIPALSKKTEETVSRVITNTTDNKDVQKAPTMFELQKGQKNTATQRKIPKVPALQRKNEEGISSIEANHVHQTPSTQGHSERTSSAGTQHNIQHETKKQSTNFNNLSTTNVHNNQQQMEVLYTPAVKHGIPSSTKHQEPKEDKSKIKETTNPPSGVNSTEDIAKLGIDDVCHYLKVLKLERHVNAFREQLIDGALLLELDDDILKEEFGMNRIETIRLTKFINSAHIPMN